MKQATEPTHYDFDDHARCAIQIAPPEDKPEASAEGEVPRQFRHLRANELVSRGDFVVDDHQTFELWNGPTGFRADAFVKAVYRINAGGSLVANESK